LQCILFYDHALVPTGIVPFAFCESLSSACEKKMRPKCEAITKLALKLVARGEESGKQQQKQEQRCLPPSSPVQKPPLNIRPQGPNWQHCAPVQKPQQPFCVSSIPDLNFQLLQLHPSKFALHFYNEILLFSRAHFTRGAVQRKVRV
jgi:hypothetical protein